MSPEAGREMDVSVTTTSDPAQVSVAATEVQVCKAATNVPVNAGVTSEVPLDASITTTSDPLQVSKAAMEVPVDTGVTGEVPVIVSVTTVISAEMQLTAMEIPETSTEVPMDNTITTEVSTSEHNAIEMNNFQAETLEDIENEVKAFVVSSEKGDYKTIQGKTSTENAGDNEDTSSVTDIHKVTNSSETENISVRKEVSEEKISRKKSRSSVALVEVSRKLRSSVIRGSEYMAMPQETKLQSQKEGCAEEKTKAKKPAADLDHALSETVIEMTDLLPIAADPSKEAVVIADEVLGLKENIPPPADSMDTGQDSFDSEDIIESSQDSTTSSIFKRPVTHECCIPVRRIDTVREAGSMIDMSQGSQKLMVLVPGDPCSSFKIYSPEKKSDSEHTNVAKLNISRALSFKLDAVHEKRSKSPKEENKKEQLDEALMITKDKEQKDSNEVKVSVLSDNTNKDDTVKPKIKKNSSKSENKVSTLTKSYIPKPKSRQDRVLPEESLKPDVNKVVESQPALVNTVEVSKPKTRKSFTSKLEANVPEENVEKSKLRSRKQVHDPMLSCVIIESVDVSTKAKPQNDMSQVKPKSMKPDEIHQSKEEDSSCKTEKQNKASEKDQAKSKAKEVSSSEGEKKPKNTEKDQIKSKSKEINTSEAEKKTKLTEKDQGKSKSKEVNASEEEKKPMVTEKDETKTKSKELNVSGGEKKMNIMEKDQTKSKSKEIITSETEKKTKAIEKDFTEPKLNASEAKVVEKELTPSKLKEINLFDAEKKTKASEREQTKSKLKESAASKGNIMKCKQEETNVSVSEDVNVNTAAKSKLPAEESNLSTKKDEVPKTKTKQTLSVQAGEVLKTRTRQQAKESRADETQQSPVKDKPKAEENCLNKDDTAKTRLRQTSIKKILQEPRGVEEPISAEIQTKSGKDLKKDESLKNISAVAAVQKVPVSEKSSKKSKPRENNLCSPPNQVTESKSNEVNYEEPSAESVLSDDNTETVRVNSAVFKVSSKENFKPQAGSSDTEPPAIEENEKADTDHTIEMMISKIKRIEQNPENFILKRAQQINIDGTPTKKPNNSSDNEKTPSPSPQKSFSSPMNLLKALSSPSSSVEKIRRSHHKRMGGRAKYMVGLAMGAQDLSQQQGTSELGSPLSSHILDDLKSTRAATPLTRKKLVYNFTDDVTVSTTPDVDRIEEDMMETPVQTPVSVSDMPTKRTLKQSGETGTPPSKKKRVWFPDPEVSATKVFTAYEEMEESSEVEGGGKSYTRNKLLLGMRRRDRKLRVARRRSANTASPLRESSPINAHYNDATASSQNSPDLTGVTSQGTVEEILTELLNSQDAFFPPLVTCMHPIESIAHRLTTHVMWTKALVVELNRKNIRTVGDLSRLDEASISRLPVATPKIARTREVLEHYHKLLVDKGGSKGEDGHPCTDSSQSASPVSEPSRLTPADIVKYISSNKGSLTTVWDELCESSQCNERLSSEMSQILGSRVKESVSDIIARLGKDAVLEHVLRTDFLNSKAVQNVIMKGLLSNGIENFLSKLPQSELARYVVRHNPEGICKAFSDNPSVEERVLQNYLNSQLASGQLCHKELFETLLQGDWNNGLLNSMLSFLLLKRSTEEILQKMPVENVMQFATSRLSLVDKIGMCIEGMMVDKSGEVSFNIYQKLVQTVGKKISSAEFATINYKVMLEKLNSQ